MQSRRMAIDLVHKMVLSLANHIENYLQLARGGHSIPVQELDWWFEEDDPDLGTIESVLDQTRGKFQPVALIFEEVATALPAWGSRPLFPGWEAASWHGITIELAEYLRDHHLN